MATILEGHLESNQDIRGGRPRIAGTRIAVEDVVILHLRLGLSVDEIAGKYDVPLAAVYSALAYYHDHRDEIDGAIEADEAYVEAFRRSNPSVLQAKLRSASGN